MSSEVFHYPSDSEDDDHDYDTIRNLSRNSPSDDEASDLNGHGDYSTRMEEIFSEGGSGDRHDRYNDKDGRREDDNDDDDDDDDEEGFLYTGKDAELSSGRYQEQLKDVLDGDELDSEADAAGRSPDLPEYAHQLENVDRVHLVETAPSEASTSSSLAPRSMKRSTTTGPPYTRQMSGVNLRPFLHPSISRLRSSLPNSQQQRIVSTSTLGTAQLLGRDVLTPSPSHFSSVSRTSSASNLRLAHSPASRDAREEPEAFKWTTLRVISDQIYRKSPDKATAVLGSPILGAPTVLAANGLICVGTDVGRVFVFDFKQDLKGICGDDNSARTFGAVTALALSHDHTFVAVGHISGHIQLYDIKHPQTAARIVPPTTISSVRSGRREGHIQGSRIVSLGFISGRHTAFVSADDQGLSFYHSLGKVLFMDANDCLRLLGKYPEEESTTPNIATVQAGLSNGSALRSIDGSTAPRAVKQPRKPNSILAMGPLPLGTTEHPTDNYQLVAMLTPIKLIIVGLRPTPKTWFRRHREEEEEEDENTGRSKWRGCLAWFPSVSTTEDVAKKRPSKKYTEKEGATAPLLAYSWGNTLFILRVYESRVKRTVQNEKTGRTDQLDIGKVNFDSFGSLTLQSDILVIQWLNSNQIILITDSVLHVFEIRTTKIVESVPYDASNLVSPTLVYSSSGIIAYHDSVRDIQHSIRTYKGKVFSLGYKEMKVGTLLSWADRILSYVERGDFLSAINLASDYYLGRARGNKNGLPERVDKMHAVVGEKISDLMVASARYAFSMDRLTDLTHVTPDNSGVDRTTLFEELVSTCVRACIAVDEFDFLFEDLFQYYDESGILSIYLHQLEPFILEGAIHSVPPRITQRLVAMHDEAGDYEAVERLIWHIDPDCLDINQALTICQKYELYDALIYIYNSALNDYITPIVELIELVRRIQLLRKGRALGMTSDDSDGDSVTEHKLIISAYKIYPYLASTLSGQRYPSETHLPLEDARKAQNDAFSFVFHGRSSVWPSGQGGRLVLTADEEGGVEPTYPYTRLLLRFDSEAFLHVLDIAFEQSYLNDEANGISRQIVIKILFDIMSTSGPELSQADITFVNIFIARNVPKYPQFIHVAPSYLQSLLIGLASDTDQSTREDRQLAAESLLSAYTPNNSEEILRLFEEAGFYRILRTWHRQERQWASLLSAYVHDPDLPSDELFRNVEETLSQANYTNANRLPDSVLSGLQDSIPTLLQGNIPRTALVIDKYVPDMHDQVLENFNEDDKHKKYAYLRCLLGPPPSSEELQSYTREGGPSTSVSSSLRKLYLKLLCKLEPSSVIVGLEYLPRESLRLEEIIRICEESRMFEAVVWLLNEDNAIESLSKLEKYSRDLALELKEELLRIENTTSVPPFLPPLLNKFDALYRMGIDICREHSEQTVEADVPLEDLWFELLKSQIDAIQSISSTNVSEKFLRTSLEEQVIKSLRALVQDAFTDLVAVSSAKAVSLPRLFKRLVDSAERPQGRVGTKYAEFRNIITSMLDSYRSESDVLAMSKRITDSDFFDVLEQFEKVRAQGWSAPAPRCPKCTKPVNTAMPSSNDQPTRHSIVVSRLGVYHSSCFHVDKSPT